MEQISGLVFKITDFRFHSEAQEVTDNLSVFLEIFLMPLCSTAEFLHLFPGESCPTFTKLSTIFPDPSVYLKNAPPEFKELAESLFTGEIPICDYFSCPENYRVDSLAESFSFVNMTIRKLDLVENKEYFSIFQDSSQRAASNPLD